MPSFIKIAEDISDKDMFQPHSLCMVDFKLPDETIAKQLADKVDLKTASNDLQKNMKSLQSLDWIKS